MANVYQAAASAVERGEAVALATIVRVAGSTPRGVGTKMLIHADGNTEGTIGGGELEARVIAGAREALRSGEPRLASFTLHDTETGDPGICGGEADVFIDVLLPNPTLLIVGAGHVAVPVAELGALLGFRTVVFDDRAEFASKERFPRADELIVGDIPAELAQFPANAQTHVVIVTRGHAYDEAALRTVLDSPVAYVGMIGSRRKVRTVFDHLRTTGVSEDALARVRAPIGLDIGAETPAEIAVSIMAEIVMLHRGGQ
ncbi:MAG: XdhC/CoxI family protein, partial [Chloroflexota bacterium]|nr:XdhC/CoxI family protein [Chloroflexota bacterium]